MGYKFGLSLFAAVSALAVGTSFAQAPSASTGPVVSVTGGQLQGRMIADTGVAAFKAVPYAAPPIANLRWREPQPVKPWAGVLQAATMRPGCGDRPGGGQGVNGAAATNAAPATKYDVEDCLYLNLWAPNFGPAGPSGQKKPVMMFISGGGLNGGSGALADGIESLAQKGVIVVSANYRGGVLGMMGHPELTKESPNKASGTYGMDDEIAVLEWIQKNISKFGGDPDNVMAFGFSGGAHMMSMLLASPRTKGLIDKAAIHSGAPYQSVRPYLTHKELEQIGLTTAEMNGAPKTNQLEFLRGLPGDKLAAAMPAVRTKLMKDNDYLAYDWGVDGWSLTRPANEVWSAHEELKIPLMVGSSGVDSSSAPAGIGGLPNNATAEQTREWKRTVIERFFKGYPDLTQRALQLYGVTEGPNEISSYPPYGTDIQQLGLHINHACSVGITASNHSAIAPTYVWEFNIMTPNRPPGHGSELRYLFGYKNLEDDAARAQSDRMQRYWVNFAKTGNPNGAGLPTWTAYNTTTKTTLQLNNEGPVEKQKLREVVCGPYVEAFARNPKRMSSGAGLTVRGIGGAM